MTARRRPGSVAVMGNNVKVSLPAANHMNVAVSGLTNLLDDLAELGVDGVLVTDVVSDIPDDENTPEEHRFAVELTAQQLAGLINQHAFQLLNAKYSA